METRSFFRGRAVRWCPGCAAALLGIALLAGCARKADEPAENPGEKHYPLRGEVLSIDRAHGLLTISHEAIPGYMPAMVMEFPVSAGDLAVARPHERIRADLVLDAAGAARLEKIWPDDRESADAVAAGANLLRQDTHERGGGAYREVGEDIPEFALYDQDGRVVQSGQFRGRQVMLNFIYTRCPIATMCPASTAKMMSAQRMARAAGIKNIQFVTITMDGAYDTPGVLREYADVRGIDTGNFSFLTGPDGAIRDLLTQFGVSAEFQGNILVHTLATLLIDERGKIIWRADGSSWDPRDFVARMRKP
jgi:protein SCO1/2